MTSRIFMIGLTALLAGCGSPAASNESAKPSVESAKAEKTAPSEANRLIRQGWRETVLSVSDLDEWRVFFSDITGWELRAEGEVPRAQLSAWKLPETANARFALFANPGSTTGFIRIIDFDGVEQERIRHHDQPWETGGIYNLNMRVSNMEDIARKVTGAGWQAPSAPVRFTFGPFIVWEWIPRHKDGVRIAFIERVEPPLENWPNLKTTSRTFNSTQMVPDMDRALAFYRGVLGFETYLENVSASKEPGEHVLGMSHEAMTSIVRNVQILQPEGDNEGSVELLKFEGYSGRDFSDRAVPPNLGNLMLRFPVDDADALAGYLKERNITLEYPPTDTTLAPYGDVKILAIRAPDGAWLEFFEDLSAPE